MDPEREIFGALPPRRDDSPEFLDKETGFWAEIETDEGNGKYTFKEKVRNDATTWADKTGGRTGDCYESNDTTGIAEKTIIQIRIEHDATGTLRYIFNNPVQEGDGTWTSRDDTDENEIIHIGPGSYYAGGECRNKTNPACGPKYAVGVDQCAHTIGWWYVDATLIWRWYSPFGAADPAPAYDAWDSGKTYAQSDKVTYAGHVWVSLQNGNENHQPDTSPTWWQDNGAA